MKKIKVITPEDNEFYEIMREIDPDTDAMDVFDSMTEEDPDLIKTDNHLSKFFEYEYKDRYYWITNETDYEVVKALDYAQKNWNKLPNLNTWIEFKLFPNTIAYRAGTGYFYTIKKLNL